MTDRYVSCLLYVPRKVIGLSNALKASAIALSMMVGLIGTIALSVCAAHAAGVVEATDEKQGQSRTSRTDDSIRLENALCYRFDERLQEAVISESVPAETIEDSRIMLWPSHSNNPPILQGENAEIQIADTLLKFTCDNQGKVIFSEGLGIYTPSVESIALTLRTTGTKSLRIAWRPRLFTWNFIGDCFINFDVEPDGQMHHYVVRLDNNDLWREYRIVDGLQLLSESAASLEIEKIEVRTRKGLFAETGIGMREYVASSDTRQSLYMHAPARLVYRLPLSEHPVFSSGIATVEDDKPSRFQVTLFHEGQPTVVLDEQVTESNKWKDFRLDLAEFSGREVELEFRVSSEKSGQIALWSNPCVYELVSKGGKRSAPNILVYLVDALRADHLDAYGYAKPTAPHLLSLAQGGVLFDNCLSQETCTKPSVMTIYSGLDSLVHGYNCHTGADLKHEPPLFSTQLRMMGYSTCAISQNCYAPPTLFSQKAFCRQVELYDTDATVTEPTYQAVSKFLEDTQDRPFYLYVHTMECHELWAPEGVEGFTLSPPFDRVWKDPENASPVDQYDASIAFADYNFNRVRKKLQELGLLEDTLIIFTADHGFALGERGEWAHGREPYNDQIHVPLIIQWPNGGLRQRTIPDLVQLADLYPTILDFAGITPLPPFQGASLLPLIYDRVDSLGERPIFSYHGFLSDSASVTLGTWKLLRTIGREERLYSFSKDRTETKDWSGEHADIAEDLRQILKRHIKKQAQLAEEYQSAPETEKEVYIDPVKIEILKSLGYLGG